MQIEALDYIKTVVCEYYNIPIQDLDLPNKFSGIITPRQVYHYLMRKYSKSKLAIIDDTRYHSTVIHSEKVITYKYKTNKTIRKDVDALCHIIENSNVSESFRSRLTHALLKKALLKDILRCKDRKTMYEVIKNYYDTGIKIIDTK